MSVLRVLSAGAARGLVLALQHEFEEATGATLTATFAPVGVVGRLIRDGEPFDAAISSAARVVELTAQGHLAAPPVGDLGSVPTAVAVRSGDPAPDVASADGWRDAVSAASALYCPDPDQATAGAHLAVVLDRLGLGSGLPPLRTFPHGAAAMAALARSTEAAPLGCAQLTEIRATAGVRAVGGLPPPFDLSTPYRAAVGVGSPEPEAAARFVLLLASARHAALRSSLGFAAGPPEGA